MSLQPVVSCDEPVRIALCPTCSGYELFCLQRFLNKQDQEDIQRLRAAGYTIFTKPLHKAHHIKNCECGEVSSCYDQSAAIAAARVPLSVRVPGREAVGPRSRPTLSLRRKVAVSPIESDAQCAADTRHLRISS